MQGADINKINLFLLKHNSANLNSKEGHLTYSLQGVQGNFSLNILYNLHTNIKMGSSELPGQEITLLKISVTLS